jgi:replicative DNA helicase
MSDGDWQKLARKMSAVSEAPLFIDDSPNMTMMEIRAKCRRLKQRHDLRLVIIDYLQLMTSGKKVESRQQEVSEFSRALKLLAKELEVPVIAISQLNRGPEQRTDKKPMLSDLRESGSLEQDADMVILLHREDAYERESPRAGEADFIVAKHRNGPTSTVTVAFQGHYSRFVDMAQV